MRTEIADVTGDGLEDLVTLILGDILVYSLELDGSGDAKLVGYYRPSLVSDTISYWLTPALAWFSLWPHLGIQAKLFVADLGVDGTSEIIVLSNTFKTWLETLRFSPDVSPDMVTPSINLELVRSGSNNAGCQTIPFFTENSGSLVDYSPDKLFFWAFSEWLPS